METNHLLVNKMADNTTRRCLIGKDALWRKMTIRVHQTEFFSVAAINSLRAPNNFLAVQSRNENTTTVHLYK